MLARRLLVGSAVAAALSVVLLVTVWLATGREAPTADPGIATARPPEAVARLAAWDERRASAWAAGDVVALRALYVDGSRTGRRDVAMLRAWVGRGLVVEGLRSQVLSAHVLRDDDPGDRSVVLSVTDRTLGGVAVGAGRRIALPADRPSTREVRLRRVEGTWLVDEVLAGSVPGVSPGRWR